MLINLLFIITAIIGFLTVSIILTIYKSNQLVNVYLIVAFTVISSRNLFSGFYLLGYLTDVKGFYGNSFNFSIILLPCFYLYFKNLAANRKKFIPKDLIHFVFPFLFLVSNAYIDKEVFPTIPLNYIFYSVFLLYACTLCFFSYKILKNIWIKLEDLKSKNKQHILISNWTFYLFMLLVLNTIRLFISLYLEICDNNYASGQSTQWIASLIWISIFFKILVSPEILYGYTVFNHHLREDKISNLMFDSAWNLNASPDLNNSQDIKLKDKVAENIVDYISEMEKISFEFESFRDPNFSLSALATKMNVPTSHLTFLFKHHSDISFSDFKKQIRIHHSIQLIKSNYLNTNTLDSLAKEVGFSSYNPFFTSFKNVTGNSPQDYNKRRKSSNFSV